MDVPTERLVRVNRVTAPCLVLGSRGDPQRYRGVLRREVELAVRRSGGGAVWLSPGSQVWIDVVVPLDDPLHTHDIRRSAVTVGEAWMRALEIEDTSVWSAAMTEPRLSELACFAGVGPGEVLHGGRKLVGISQRRTSRWSRFQCVLYLTWDPSPLLAVLAPSVGPGSPGTSGDRTASATSEWARLEAQLTHGVAVLPPGHPARCEQFPDQVLAGSLAGALGSPA